MSLHMQKEIERLKKLLLTLSAIVEENVGMAARSVQIRDEDLAERVVEADQRVDRMAVAVEEECLKIIALHQPVAIDLRFIAATFKINSDLERIGDLAVSVAKNTIKLRKYPKPNTPLNISGLASMVKTAFKKSLDAMVNLDSPLAREVMREEADIDALHNDIKDALYTAMEKNPPDLKALLLLLQVSRRLERIADHANRIAADVIYMVDAEIVRRSND